MDIKINRTRFYIWLAVFAIAVLMANTVLAETIGLTNPFFSDQKWGNPMEPANFKSGSPVFFHTKILDLKPKKDGNYSVKADMMIISPKGTVAFFGPDIINEANLDKSNVKEGKLPANFSVEMKPEYDAGDYTFLIVVTDMVTGKKEAASRIYHYK